MRLRRRNNSSWATVLLIPGFIIAIPIVAVIDTVFGEADSAVRNFVEALSVQEIMMIAGLLSGGLFLWLAGFFTMGDKDEQANVKPKVEQ